MAKPRINEYKIKVDPPTVPEWSSEDQRMLHETCSDPGNFSVVLAVKKENKLQIFQEKVFHYIVVKLLSVCFHNDT